MSRSGLTRATLLVGCLLIVLWQMVPETQLLSVLVQRGVGGSTLVVWLLPAAALLTVAIALVLTGIRLRTSSNALRPFARVTAAVSLLLALALSGYVLLGPTTAFCVAGPIGAPLADLEADCTSTNLLARGVSPLGLLMLVAWAAAPALAVLGTAKGGRAAPISVLVALVIESTSLGATALRETSLGILVGLYVVPLLLIALLAALAPTDGGARRESHSAAQPTRDVFAARR